MGWSSRTADELKEAESKWNSDIWPALDHLLKRIEGPLLGGTKPSIADLAFLGNTLMVLGKTPDSFVAKSAGLRAYFDALRAALPKRSEYLAAAEGFWK